MRQSVHTQLVKNKPRHKTLYRTKITKDRSMFAMARTVVELVTSSMTLIHYYPTYIKWQQNTPYLCITRCVICLSISRSYIWLTVIN